VGIKGISGRESLEDIKKSDRRICIRTEQAVGVQIGHPT